VARLKNRFATPPSWGSRIKSGKASGMVGNTQWPVVARSTVPDFALPHLPNLVMAGLVPATHRRANKSRSRFEAAWWVAGPYNKPWP